MLLTLCVGIVISSFPPFDDMILKKVIFLVLLLLGAAVFVFRERGREKAFRDEERRYSTRSTLMENSEELLEEKKWTFDREPEEPISFDDAIAELVDKIHAYEINNAELLVNVENEVGQRITYCLIQPPSRVLRNWGLHKSRLLNQIPHRERARFEEEWKMLMHRHGKSKHRYRIVHFDIPSKTSQSIYVVFFRSDVRPDLSSNKNTFFDIEDVIVKGDDSVWPFKHLVEKEE